MAWFVCVCSRHYTLFFLYLVDQQVLVLVHSYDEYFFPVGVADGDGDG